MSYYVAFRCLSLVKCSGLFNGILVRSISSGHRIYNDNSLVSTPNSAFDQDILMKSIKCSKETSDVLHYIGKHHSIMNRSHILQAFKIIFSIQKSEGTSMSNGEVSRSAEFLTLCNVLKSRVRTLEVNETVDVLKTLSYLGVPASSKLVSILLNLLASRVNELTLHHIMFLDFLIKDFKPTPIVEALKLALPVVFQANLKVKLDRDNVVQACDLLYFVTKKKLQIETVDFLVDVIMNLRKDLDLDSAISVIKSLCNFGPSDESHRPLLHHAFDVVLDNINKCSFSDLDILLSKCVVKYSRDNYFFYHEEFVNSVSHFVVNNNCGFEEGIWTLRKLNKLGHVEIGLLDYLARKAEVELLNAQGIKASALFTLVKGFSTADYKPHNWAVLEPTIVKITQDMFAVSGEVPWLSYIRDLCTLGTWPLTIIEKMFQADFLDNYLKSHKNVLDHLQVLALYQEVTTLCPEQYRPSPPPKILDDIIDINGKNVTQNPLLSSLQRGLGGASYVASGLYTNLGHFLHHVVVLRKGGYPVPLNTTISKSDSRLFVDDLRIPEDHQPVAVMHLPCSFYCSNVDKLKGTVRQNLNSISALGLTVVPISSSRWEALLEHEKIPYLMREINEKCDFTSTETVTKNMNDILQK